MAQNGPRIVFPGERPLAVTVAAGLLAMQFVVALVNLAIGFANRDQLTAARRAARQAAGGKDAVDPDSAAYSLGSTLGATLVVVVAIGLVVLAVLVYRGNQVARVVTWVACAFGLCCGVMNSLGAIAATSSGGGVLAAVQLVAVSISLIAYIATAVLLALPPSNAFFAKPTED